MFIFFSFVLFLLLFFFNDPATTEIYTLSLHDALPISPMPAPWAARNSGTSPQARASFRSEEHTSELQSRRDLVCRLLLEKKNTVRKIRRPSDQASSITTIDRLGPIERVTTLRRQMMTFFNARSG